ncbi:MAG: CapA family protein [Acidimicrobiia bacterium]|nr:CapA family protein [Acidimicrobiia bacterium]
MRLALLAVATAVLVAGCGDIVVEGSPEVSEPTGDTPARILLVGDVMTGRGLARLIESDPESVFAGVRHLIAAADIAGANLESPLTGRPHTSANEHMLAGDPKSATTLAAAGFDLMSLPNNHATDAGLLGLVDTIDAVVAAGMQVVGAGEDHHAATSPTIVQIGDLAIGFLAFDATGVAQTAGEQPGVSTWDSQTSPAAAAALRDLVDVVVVSVHGGTEYLPVTDPGMSEIADALAEAGTDVVWGHGAHVNQPVQVRVGIRPAVVATSLGNFLFDQGGSDRTTGAMLEVLADAAGVLAYRVGIAEHPDRRVEFVGWLPPEGDSAWLHDSWWNLVRSIPGESGGGVELDAFRYGDLVDAVEGDITGDGNLDLVVSFRRPHRTTPFMELHPEVQWADASGRSAHLGVYVPESLREIWVAGTVLQPVAGFAVCDGALATIHDQLDDPTIVAGGAWVWNGFGFDTAPDIPGRGTPGCADVDGDGKTDPVIVDRS